MLLLSQVIGVSVDSHFSHHAWKSTPLSKGGIGDIKFPLVSDLSKEISHKYGVLVKQGTISLRGLFLIDKEGNVPSFSCRSVESVLSSLRPSFLFVTLIVIRGRNREAFSC